MPINVRKSQRQELLSNVHAVLLLDSEVRGSDCGPRRQELWAGNKNEQEMKREDEMVSNAIV